MKNKIEDLRNHLFATLEALQDKDHPMEIDRARAVADVAKVLVESAKVECEHMKLTGSDGSGFIPEQPKKIVGLLDAKGPRLVNGKDMQG